MCQCGKLLRPNKSTLDRIRAAFEALKALYYRAAPRISRGKKCGHNPWQQDHHKSRDALKCPTEREKYTSIWDRWQNHEVYRASQLAQNWTDEWVKYLDFIAHCDISHDAPHWQRARYNNMIHLRSLDSNKQAGPLCKRPGYKEATTPTIIIIFKLVTNATVVEFVILGPSMARINRLGL